MLRSLLFVGVLSAPVLVSAQLTTNDGIFTLDQALAGQSAYALECAACHGVSLGGGEGGNALIGSEFLGKWSSMPLSTLYAVTSLSMPVVNPGGLSQKQYQDILAYMLLANGYPAGEHSLQAGTPAMASRSMQMPEGDVDALMAQLDSHVHVPSGLTQEWPSVRADAGSSNYSSLDLINQSNVQQLEIAWRWSAANFGAAPEFNFQATPVMANGTLYTTAGNRRVPVAIDATSGETLWMYRLDEGRRGESAPRTGSGRGVAYTEEDGHARVFYITPGYRLIGLDAATGQPLPDFGDYGTVDLKTLLDQEVDLERDPIGASSAPIVVNNTIIVGSAFPPGGAPSSPEMVKGHTLGIDLDSGERKWIFHTVPQETEFGNDTWLEGSWRYTGNTGAWAQLSGDPELDMVYVPVEAATGDFYGGHRPGDNLFSQSIVALNASTGERQWHFQMVKHGVWDYDPPAPPVLFDSRQDGEIIPALAQVSKQGFVYAFDRRDGTPLWPIEDRPVPQSAAPGEVTSATQPFPTKPAPFAPQGMSEAQLNNLTPEIFAEAKRIASSYTMGPLYTPPSLVTPSNNGTLVLPSAFGGANWPGGVVDLETAMLYVSASHDPGVMGLSENGRSSMNLVAGGVRYIGPFGLPLTKPPYGTITAIDMNTGEHIWRMANGDTPASIADHPKLQGVEIPRTGQAERVGMLVTKSLLFAGEGSGLYATNGGGPMLRAHDKQTGEILWQYQLPANQSGLPMTYAINGEQYIVIPVGARGHPGELVALKLP